MDLSVRLSVFMHHASCIEKTTPLHHTHMQVSCNCTCLGKLASQTSLCCCCRYHRVEVLAALASVLCSWAVTGILVAEAVHRIINPTPVNGKLMFFLALAGIAINVLNLLILGGHHHHGVGGHDHDHGHSHAGDAHSHGHSHGDAGHSHDHGAEGHDEGNINLRGAVIHVLGDFVQSIGVAVAGALIWWKQVVVVYTHLWL